MKAAKKTILVMCIIIFSLSNGCANGNLESKTYTYNDLNEVQQKVIDGVYESYSAWSSVYDSSQNFPVTNITFFKEDGLLIFATYYTCSDPDDGYGITATYEVNPDDGKLSVHKYDYLFSDRDDALQRSAIARAARGDVFLTNESVDMQKDVLANAYYKAISE